MASGENVTDTPKALPPGDVPAWYHAVVEAQQLVEETVIKGSEVCTRIEALTVVLKESTMALAHQMTAGVEETEREGAKQRAELAATVRAVVAEAREASIVLDPAFVRERRRVFWLSSAIGVLIGAALGAALAVQLQP